MFFFVQFFHNPSNSISIMGQTNFQKIQQAIANLSEIQAIDKSKAELFLKDYINSGEKIKDVNYFIQTSSIDLFLKYFIKCTYKQVEAQKQQDYRNKKVQNHQISLAQKIVQSGCTQIKQKTRYLLNDLKKIYTSSNSEIVTVRQRVKDIIVSHLGVQSYRYYCYRKNTLKQTNSKILYLYESSHSKKIQKYMEQRLEQEIQSKKQIKLQTILKQLYPQSQHYYFQHPQADMLHLIIFQVFPDKWKYHECLDESKIKKILNNIFIVLCQNMQAIYDSEHKISEIIYKNFFSHFTLLLLQIIVNLQSFRISYELKSLKSLEQVQLTKYLHEVQQFRQKIVNKLRYWKKQCSQKQKKIFLNYNYSGRKLEYVFTNDQKYIVYDQKACNLDDMESTFNYFFPQNKKYIKKITKAIEQEIENTTIKISSNCQIHIHRNFYSNSKLKPQYSVSLMFIFAKNHTDNRQQHLLQSEKLLIKRLKTENPQIHSAGWFRCFLTQQNQNYLSKSIQNQKRKNNLKLPKLNKQFRISNFKAIYSLEDLRQDLNIDNENFNLLQLSSAKLQVFAIKVFSRLEYFKGLPHEGDQFPNFLREIHFNYQTHDNPFHNFTHAINVMHTCYFFTKTKKNNDLISNFDKFSIIFSGLCHDVGHTGYTNLFQIAKQSQIAILYNNKSPLQNYHASKTFQILRKKQNNFLTSLTQRQFKRFRQLIISNILYTDIKEHFSLMKKFEQSKNVIQSDDIKLLAGMIVHASDFGGSVKVFQICKTWSLLVNEQFSRQYQEEGKFGLPQTVFMKDLNIMGVLAKNQKGFLKVIVQPLYKQLTQFYQDDELLNSLLKNIQNNINQWQKIIDAENNRCIQAK